MFAESWVINCFLWLNLAIFGWTLAAYIRRESLTPEQPTPDDSSRD